MTRFYLRIVLAMFLVMMACIVVFQHLGKELEKRFFKPKSIQHLTELANALREDLRELSQSEAEGVIRRMEAEREIPIRLVAVNDLVRDFPNDSSRENRLIIDLANQSYVVVIEPTTQELNRFIKEEERTMGKGTIRVLFIIGLAGFFIGRPLVKKIRLQEETIAKIADGDLSARVVVDSKDAVGRLGERINLMADRIQELLGQQRQLVQAVSHEMRTPTARIGFALEMLGEAKTDEERERRIDSLNEDLQDMDQLLDELLTFLRFDEASTPPLEKETIALKAMLEEVSRRVLRFRPELELETVCSDKIEVPVSVRYFPRVLENVLMNAMRHASARIQVTAVIEGKQAIVSIGDDGPGIPQADHEHLFEPFRRLDPSRDRKTGGTGLGLAIAKRIVEKHEGTIDIDTASLGGAQFTIRIPVG